MNFKLIASAAAIATSVFLTSCDSDDALEVAPVAEVGPGSAADFIAQMGAEGDRVFFKYNKSDVASSEKAKIEKQIAWLKQYAHVQVTVEGHCDVRGTAEYNMALGNRRAEAVKAHLIAQGIDAARISVVSFGKERPESAGNTEADHAKNRRGVTVVAQ